MHHLSTTLLSLAAGWLMAATAYGFSSHMVRAVAPIAGLMT